MDPSHFPAQVPLPAQAERGVVVGEQVPLALEVLQDSHWPVQASLQQTPSAQWPLAHSPSPLQAMLLVLATQVPLSQTGVFPPHVGQQVACETHMPLHSFMPLPQPAVVPPEPVIPPDPAGAPPDAAVMPPDAAIAPPDPDAFTPPEPGRPPVPVSARAPPLPPAEPSLPASLPPVPVVAAPASAVEASPLRPEEPPLPGEPPEAPPLVAPPEPPDEPPLPCDEPPLPPDGPFASPALSAGASPARSVAPSPMGPSAPFSRGLLQPETSVHVMASTSAARGKSNRRPLAGRDPRGELDRKTIEVIISCDLARRGWFGALAAPAMTEVTIPSVGPSP